MEASGPGTACGGLRPGARRGAALAPESRVHFPSDRFIMEAGNRARKRAGRGGRSRSARPAGPVCHGAASRRARLLE